MGNKLFWLSWFQLHLFYQPTWIRVDKRSFRVECRECPREGIMSTQYLIFLQKFSKLSASAWKPMFGPVVLEIALFINNTFSFHWNMHINTKSIVMRTVIKETSMKNWIEMCFKCKCQVKTKQKSPITGSCWFKWQTKMSN